MQHFQDDHNSPLYQNLENDDYNQNDNNNQLNLSSEICFKVETIDDGGIIEFLGEEEIPSELNLNITTITNNHPFIFNIPYTVI